MPLAAVITAEFRELDSLKDLATLFDGEQTAFHEASFQVYFKSPAEALLPLLRARTLDPELRACLALGDVTGILRDLKTARGEAFELSRSGFKEDERLRIVCGDAYPAVREGLLVLGRFLDCLFHDMKGKHLAVIRLLLEGCNFPEVASRLDKPEATISKRASSAGWPQIQQALASYQTFVSTMK